VSQQFLPYRRTAGRMSGCSGHVRTWRKVVPFSRLSCVASTYRLHGVLLNSDVGRTHYIDMFCTVLYRLKSPQNVGMIIRSHVAFGGERVVFVGHEHPWQFKKGTQSFSRKLQERCDLVSISTDDEFFAWCLAEDLHPVALEIASPPTFLNEFRFPQRTALIVGSEGTGLPASFLQRCAAVVTIPQHGRLEA
jgi:23S rRNA (guanosine2251-2'-O)-methyltransferase